MKLLFDENLSYRVVHGVQQFFPESLHVISPLLKIRDDSDIFYFARDNDFTIVPFDEFFYDLQLIKGFPPKIIWLRFGNSSNLKIINKLFESREAILSFAENTEAGILEIY
jgi:predicted nuclease of predicted toxin-antitoxin system